MTKRRVKPVTEVEMEVQQKVQAENKVKLIQVIKQDGAKYYVFTPKENIIEMNVDGIEPELIVVWYNKGLALEKEVYKVDGKYYVKP